MGGGTGAFQLPDVAWSHDSQNSSAVCWLLETPLTLSSQGPQQVGLPWCQGCTGLGLQTMVRQCDDHSLLHWPVDTRSLWSEHLSCPKLCFVWLYPSLMRIMLTWLPMSEGKKKKKIWDLSLFTHCFWRYLKHGTTLPLSASGVWVPNPSRCSGKSQTNMKSSGAQLSAHIPAKAVCLSFAGSRLSLTVCASLFSMRTVLLQGVTAHFWAIIK